MQQALGNSDPTPLTYANINLKVSQEEKWAFKEWCVHHRMSQVDAFRQAFELLQTKHDGKLK